MLNFQLDSMTLIVPFKISTPW